MAKRDDIPKTDSSESEALIKRLMQSNLAPRNWSSSMWPGDYAEIRMRFSARPAGRQAAMN
jgi:hypothetical protein